MTHPPLVVIVEDEPLVARFFQTALERAGGFRVKVTENVSELMHLLKTGDVALLLLDVSLTNAQYNSKSLDGIELAKLVRQSSASRVPILMATAHAMHGDRERILQSSGADDLIHKPVYDAAALVERVRNLLATNAAKAAS
jgi:two-component system, cell cycle response regulator DivK